MAALEMIQCKLQQGNSFMVTWVPKDKRIKVGTRLTLEKVEGDWTVVSKSEPTAASNIKRGWNNNI